MRNQLTIYLPDELCERFKRAAERAGLSLSAYCTRQLATSSDQVATLQIWLSTRLDAFNLRLERLEDALAATGLNTRIQNLVEKLDAAMAANGAGK